MSYDSQHKFSTKNYGALVSGSPQGGHADCNCVATDCSHSVIPTLLNVLRKSRAKFVGCSKGFMKRHLQRGKQSLTNGLKRGVGSVRVEAAHCLDLLTKRTHFVRQLF